MRTKLVFLGPPGSGKGTYASRVMAKAGIPQISTGDLLRNAVSEGTPLGKEAESYIKSGNLVPDSVVIGLVDERLKGDDCQKGFILDGFPRTIEQAKALNGIADIEMVVNLVVPEEIIVTRLSSRISCKACGEVYNIRTLPPKEEGKCDKCGSELYQRKDDTPEVIRERFEVYAKQTAPLIEPMQ